MRKNNTPNFRVGSRYIAEKARDFPQAKFCLLSSYFDITGIITDRIGLYSVLLPLYMVLKRERGPAMLLMILQLYHVS